MHRFTIKLLGIVLGLWIVMQFVVPAGQRFYVPDPACADGFKYIDNYESTCASHPRIPVGYPVAINSLEAPLVGILIAASIDLAPIFLLLALLFYLKSDVDKRNQ